MNIQVAVFMPVYNGEKYLRKTIQSLLNQTYPHFTIFCVDDSSTDSSFSILTDLAATDSRIKIFQKPNGGIVPKSWNFILPHLTGDAIMYVSQDDLFSEDLLEQMVSRKIETGAEAIVPDIEWYYDDVQIERQKLQGYKGDRDIIFSGKEACIKSLYWEIHGFALWDKRLFADIIFNEDSINDDELKTRILYYKAKKIAFSKGIFYYRNDNANAITKKVSKWSFTFITTQYRIFYFLQQNNFEPALVNRFYFNVINILFHDYGKLLKNKNLFDEIKHADMEKPFADAYALLRKNYSLSSVIKNNGIANTVKYALLKYCLFNFTLFKLFCKGFKTFMH